MPSLPLAAAADPASRQSIAPRLSVVRPRSSHDLAVDDVLTNAILADVRQPLTDPLPHPVVALLALRSTDDAVYAEVDAEREVAATTVLAAGGPSDRARHTA